MSEDLNMTPELTPAESGLLPPAEEELGLSESASQQLGLQEEQPQEEPQEPASEKPSELPEEYKPYSQFPWHEIPEESRPAFLERLKKFHGDMSRGTQEVGLLKRRVDELGQKAQWFDEITAQKWFQDAYLQQQGGQAYPPQQQKPAPQLADLTEHGIDREATNVIKEYLDEKLGTTIAPLAQNLEKIQQQLMHSEVNRELASLRSMAEKEGLPSPDTKLPLMNELVSQGRARNATDAYYLTVFDEARALSANKARQTLEEELKSKAESTVAPMQGGPANPPTEEVFTGPNAIARALRASMAELSANQKRR